MSYFSIKRFSLRQVVILLSIVFAGIAIISYATVTIPNTFSSGSTISSSQMNANFTAVKDAIDPLQVTNFTRFLNLNSGSVTVTTTPTKLNIGTRTFTKSRGDTNIEIFLNSRFDGGTFSGGASGIVFWVKIDDTIGASSDNHASIKTSDAQEFLSLYAVFQGLAAGSHTVSVWAQTNGGSSSDVFVDPGGYDGGIVVKESL